MVDDVATHYSSSDGLAELIAASLQAAGIEPESATTADLAGVDEFTFAGEQRRSRSARRWVSDLTAPSPSSQHYVGRRAVRARNCWYSRQWQPSPVLLLGS
jgi:hypothetical protein